MPVRFVRARNARRYILRILPGSVARVTIPRGGSLTGAWEFTRRNIAWLERQLQSQPADWGDGTAILLRGIPVLLRLTVAAGGRRTATVAGHAIPLGEGAVRPQVELFLRQTAAGELVPRALELAALHALEVRRVRIGNQRTRWGSCSTTKTICLNWRLIQAPEHVRDYIIIHELMHLREMSHSPRFWSHVAKACPGYQSAETWLRKHGSLLR